MGLAGVVSERDGPLGLEGGCEREGLACIA